MATRTFPNVYRRLTPLQMAIGELVVDGAALEHRSKKHGTLRMEPVRDVSVVEEPTSEGGKARFVRVVYGEGTTMGSALFAPRELRAWRVKATFDKFASDLQGVFGQAAGARDEDVERVRAADETRKTMFAAAAAKRGRTRMWIGGLAVLGGGIATAATYSAAADGGGTYYVFWGAMVFGALLFLQGIVEYRKNRGAAPDSRLPGES